MKSKERSLSNEEISKYLEEELELQRYKVGDIGSMLLVLPEKHITQANLIRIPDPSTGYFSIDRKVSAPVVISRERRQETYLKLFSEEPGYNPAKIMLTTINYNSLENLHWILPLDDGRAFHYEDRQPENLRKRDKIKDMFLRTILIK